MANSNSSRREDAGQKLPPDALVIRNLLNSMGVTEYEPRVVHQLLNFMYRHVADILQDAEAYMTRTGSEDEIGMEDLLLAIQSREAFSFIPPPSQTVLNEIAARRNKVPLPELSDKPGLVLPNNCLAVGASYQMAVPPDELLPASESAPELENGSSRRVVTTAKLKDGSNVQLIED